MAVDTKETRSILNDLIETCKDGQKGFEDAAHHVKDPSIRALFNEYSQQRAQFAGELQQEVMRLGGEPEKTGSTMGAVHRGWIDFKAKFTGDSDAAVVAEAESGEDSAKEAYEKAIKKDLPFNIQSIVAKQLEQILQAHNRVRALKSETKAHAGTGTSTY